MGVLVVTGGCSLIEFEIYRSYKDNKIEYLFLHSIYALENMKGE